MAVEPAELVAWGVALGASAAFAHGWLGRLRARLVLGGRIHAARATVPCALAVGAAALALASTEGALAGWSFLVGLIGARTCVLSECHEPLGR